MIPGTRLHELMGPGPHTVSSFHIQAVKEVGPRLKVAAVAEDGVIEAVEMSGDRMLIGIQWHPELEPFNPTSQSIFRLLIDHAREYRARR
jgi:putative glutamine amidotransferase